MDDGLCGHGLLTVAEHADNGAFKRAQSNAAEATRRYRLTQMGEECGVMDAWWTDWNRQTHMRTNLRRDLR